MKPNIGADPLPVMGHGELPPPKPVDGRTEGRNASAVPPKPRSNTVATFLNPQLLPEPLGGSHRRRSSIEIPHHARVQERRNAVTGKPLGYSALVEKSIRTTTHGASVTSAVDPSLSRMSSKASWNPDQSACSLSTSRQSSSCHRRLSASDRITGSVTHNSVRRESHSHRDESPSCSTHGTSVTRGGIRTTHRHSSVTGAPSKSSQPVSRETLTTTVDSSRSSRNCQASLTSSKHAFSHVEKPTVHRDSSVYRKDQKRAEDVTGGCRTDQAVGVGRVGSSIPTARDRLAPSALLFSATRTRDSLLVPGEGRAYHLGVQHGELYNRILTVGHAGRADWLAERFLDSHMRTLSLKSNRNFRLHSGFYKNKPVSIVSIGMGAPMMDVLVREASYLTDGPLAIVRLGTCTLLDQDLRPGSIVVATPGSLGCYTNYAFFDGTAADYSRTQEMKPYIITRPCAADPELSRLIYRHVAAHDPESVFEGLNVSAETFYSCQAREDQLFRDENENLLETLLLCGAQTMEMETHQLLHLASRRLELMKAAAVHIGVTSRTNDQFMHPITPSQLNELVAVAGKACLDALVDVAI
ncbi:uridine phosphorylase, putative [Eimeria praecox]|uniref:Uridine phosphorylase, putative n=1 Tax=Eimeria praecox TaxID=51316 RepID=U6GVR1_9EIME|nr:uridine phosphorylase, putative [Eimeria praecox]